ncbi:MAG: FKBP-type peptidyl-prolyl cis-trans isomerase [Pseudomonadales bacterium]
MKNAILINGLAILLVVTSSNVLGADETDEGNLPYDVGYFFGYSFGNILKEGGNQAIDLDGLMAGIRDSLDQKYPELTREQQEAVIAVVEANRQQRIEEQQAAQAAVQERQGAAAEENLEAAKAFLADNSERDGVKTTASGLQYEIVEEGDGQNPTADDRVRVNYEGKFIDGTVFDSTRDKKPVEFGLRQVIKGWTEGLQLVKEGGKIRLFVPPNLAYGPAGQGPIGPNSLLIFDIELLDANVNGE